MATPCFYFLSPHAQQLLSVFLEEHKDKPLNEIDAPGNFIRYLAEKVGQAATVRAYSRLSASSQSAVYTVPISGRFDVGGLATYLECDAYFRREIVVPDDSDDDEDGHTDKEEKCHGSEEQPDRATAGDKGTDDGDDGATATTFSQHMPEEVADGDVLVKRPRPHTAADEKACD